MDSKETCETLISNLKWTNLKYHLEETPFSVHLHIRKSFIKGLNGEVLHPNVQQSAHSCDLKNESENLKATIKLIETEKEAFQNDLDELRDELGKAKAVTADLMKERQDTLKVKEMSDKNLDKKQTELDIFKTYVKNLNSGNEKLEHEVKWSRKGN
jgi:Skp family chaperone for outer membrane proteins